MSMKPDLKGYWAVGCTPRQAFAMWAAVMAFTLAFTAIALYLFGAHPIDLVLELLSLN